MEKSVHPICRLLKGHNKKETKKVQEFNLLDLTTSLEVLVLHIG